MGSSRTLFCSTAFVLVLLSSASKDERFLEQRPVSFDPDKIMQGACVHILVQNLCKDQLESQLVRVVFVMQHPDMYQREVDLADLFDQREVPIEQAMMPPPERGGSRPGVLTPRGSRPRFGPRSFGNPPALEYPVQFPLARPSSDNLQAICLHGDHRPRYPASYFPASGFGQLKRRASSVNNAESWFSLCCSESETWGQEVTLCCATHAWELSIESFCEEDSSVKDRLYDCCRKTGINRLNCFHNDAPNPNYGPTEELPVLPVPPTVNFSFEPSVCQRTGVTPKNIRGNKKQKVEKPIKVEISFPPGQPTADNIESLCENQKLRPLYTVKCLAGEGHEWLARQAKAVNRMEKGFKQCCKKKQDVANCADRKWREELNKYCMVENGQLLDFHCCYTPEMAEDQFNCFRDISRDPHYNLTSATEEVTLNNLCDTHKIIKRKFNVGFNIKGMVKQCCPLSEEERTTCITQKIEKMKNQVCVLQTGAKPPVRRCCNGPSQEVAQCLSNFLMNTVTKASSFVSQKKKKKCPIS